MEKINLKMTLVGDSGTGKTSIFAHFQNNYSSQEQPTIGVDFFHKIVSVTPERIITYQIWDTGGQERFRSIVRTYFVNSLGFIFVYDITNYQSFQNLSYWVKEVETLAPRDVCKIVIGSKLDLESKRKVTVEEATAFAESIGASYFECSSHAHMNMDVILPTMEKQIMQKLETEGKIRATSRPSVSLTRFGKRPFNRSCCNIV